MRVYCTIWCLIFYFLVTLCVVHSQDLHDMFGELKDQVAEKLGHASNKMKEKVGHASTKIKEEVQKRVLNLKDGETCPATHTTEYRTVLTAYRHVIKDWMEKFPSKNAKEYRLLLEISPDEFNRLERFASSAQYEEKDVLHEVHIISDFLKRMILKIEEDKPVFSSLTWSAWLRSFDINSIIKVILALMAIGAISFISIRTHLRRGRWFTTFFIVTIVVSVIQNWYTLYQDAQAKIDEVLMKKLPKHCQGQSMGVFDMIKAKLGRFVEIPSNECLEYHKALRATPHAQVTPAQALSMTFAQLFVTPLGTIGDSLSLFFAGTMRHVPIVAWPIVMLIIVFIIVLIILMYSRRDINLFYGLLSIRPTAHPAIVQTNVVERIENAPNHSAAQVQQLENRVRELQLELQERHLQLEHNTSHTSRPRSVERTNQQRERSSSTQRPNADVLAENELRQRTTSTDVGFRRDVLPQ